MNLDSSDSLDVFETDDLKILGLDSKRNRVLLLGILRNPVALALLEIYKRRGTTFYRSSIKRLAEASPENGIAASTIYVAQVIWVKIKGYAIIGEELAAPPIFAADYRNPCWSASEGQMASPSPFRLARC